MADPVLKPLPCVSESGHEEVPPVPPGVDDGHEFLDTTTGLFSAPQEPLPGEVRRPGSSLFAWRDLFRS